MKTALIILSWLTLGNNVYSSEIPNVLIYPKNKVDILNPYHGYFEIDGYYFFNSSDSTIDSIKTEIPYSDYIPEGVRDLPFFYKKTQADSEKSLKTAVIYNFKNNSLHLNLVNADSRWQRLNWSPSLSSNFQFVREAFDVNDYPLIYTGPIRTDEEPFYMPPVFSTIPYFWNNVEILDLTYSRISELSYEIIEKMPSLHSLALSYNGSDLNNPKFKANPNVKELVVWNTVLTETGIRNLIGFKNLERLTLNGCSINHIVEESNEHVNFNKINKLTNGIKELRIVNCSTQIHQMFRFCRWESIRTVTFDFIPMDDVIGNTPLTGGVLDTLKIVIDKEHLQSFMELPGYRWLLELNNSNQIKLTIEQ